MSGNSSATDKSSFTADALANWQWLVNCPPCRDAIVVSASHTPSLHFLTAGFETVRYLHLSDAQTSATGPRTTCVALPDAAVCLRTLSHRAALTLLTRIRVDFLAPDGLYVGIESFPDSRSRLLRLGLLPGFSSRHVSLLRSAGYSNIRSWYIAPSPTEPSHIIPCKSRSVLEWDKIFGECNRMAMLRRIAMRCGLHRAAFRYRMIIATA